MKIYIVYADCRLPFLDIFSTREEAEKCVTVLSQQWGSMWIREYGLKDKYVEGET